MVLFLAISGSIFHNVAIDKVGKALPDVPPNEIGNFVAGTSSSAFQALSEAEKAIVISEIASAMKSIWAFFLAAATLSVVCSVPLLVSRQNINSHSWDVALKCEQKTKFNGRKTRGAVVV